jgi:hypothetical protein
MTRSKAVFVILQAFIAAAAAASAKHGASAKHIPVLLQGVLPGASAVNCAPCSLALAAAALAHVLCKAGAGASVRRCAVASAVLSALPQHWLVEACHSAGVLLKGMHLQWQQ